MLADTLQPTLKDAGIILSIRSKNEDKGKSIDSPNVDECLKLRDTIDAVNAVNVVNAVNHQILRRISE